MKVAVAYYCFVYRCIFALYVSGRMLLFFSSWTFFNFLSIIHHLYFLLNTWWLGSRVVSMLDSGIEGPGFKSQM